MERYSLLHCATVSCRCIKLYLISATAHHVLFQQFWVEDLKQTLNVANSTNKWHENTIWLL